MWIFDKLFNRKIEGKSSLDNLEPLTEVAEELLKLGTNGGLQYGEYIYKSYPDRFEFVGDEIPEDYTGSAIGFYEDSITIVLYENGVPGEANDLTPAGANKLNFAYLTHSFDELDPALKQIVDDAIGNGSASCSEAQWSVIKHLLDNSLYINCNGYSMIKSVIDSDGGGFAFGYHNSDLLTGASLSLSYDNNTLEGRYLEV